MILNEKMYDTINRILTLGSIPLDIIKLKRRGGSQERIILLITRKPAISASDPFGSAHEKKRFSVG
jgi:hypothetical protein